MLKIFGNCDSSSHAEIPNMFFDLNDQPYTFDTAPRNNVIYDINASTGGDYNNFKHEVKSKIKMLLFLYHDFENLTDYYVNQKNLKEQLKNPKFYFLTVQESPLHKEYDNLLYYDFMFNSTKSFYLNYPFKKETIKWHYHNDDSYVLPKITTAETKTKIFVAPNRVRFFDDRRTTYRFLLVNTLKKYKNLGYIGSVTLNKSWILLPHGDYPNCNTIDELLQNTSRRKEKWGYAPFHNLYLKDTFISIYAETVEYGNEYFVSEKTYDPLFRGHFILPFSNYKFVDRVKSLGFKLPNFINYDYDDIESDVLRFQRYNEEVQRLLNIKLDDWRQYWNENLDLIKYNRKVILDRPYDRVDLYKLL